VRGRALAIHDPPSTVHHCRPFSVHLLTFPLGLSARHRQLVHRCPFRVVRCASGIAPAALPAVHRSAFTRGMTAIRLPVQMPAPQRRHAAAGRPAIPERWSLARWPSVSEHILDAR